ncbi:MAG: PrsW family intramembrane metalloprotease [Clostridia bacterium]|nr:PrsW family intramembrane metalloprotease [Clostridia bacterium]
MIYSENILICIGAPLLVAAFFLRGQVRRFVSAFLAGMIICLLTGYINGFIHLVSGEALEETAVYISPVVEEIMKLLPLLFILLVFDPGEAELLQTAVAVGAGFATFENCCYILSSGVDSLIYTLVRGLAVGVMHIMSIMLLHLGMTIARRYRVLTATTIIGATALSIIFHGLYNLLVSQPGINMAIGYCLPLCVAAIYYLVCVPLLEAGEEGNEAGE